MVSIQNNFFTSFSKVIGIIFDTNLMIIFSLIIVAWLFARSSKKESIIFGSVMLTDAILLWIIKKLIVIQRPLNSLVAETNFAFPSGHTTSAIVFFGLLTYLISRKNSKMIYSSIFMILLISFTRLYLNVHWLTDILGGFALGTFLLTLGIILFKKWQI